MLNEQIMFVCRIIINAIGRNIDAAGRTIDAVELMISGTTVPPAARRFILRFL